jgi:fluoride ion exporter CrcB/FEX
LAAKLIGYTFLGGAIGSALRYEVSLLVPQSVYWLWIVNLLGALVLGFINVHPKLANERSQAFWGTGFAGGFTTLSALVTFATLGVDVQFVYVAIQVLVGLFAYFLGRILGGERPWRNS